jgi:rod shape-determining protein MreB
LPKTLSIDSDEIYEALVENINDLIEGIQAVIERTPPQLVGDLDRNGIVMSGGGSLIYGIDKLIERSTGIRTVVVDDAVSCAAYGAGKMLKHLDDMQDGMMNFYRKRQLKG